MLTMLVILLLIVVLLCAFIYFAPFLDAQVKMFLQFAVVAIAIIYALVRIAPGKWP